MLLETATEAFQKVQRESATTVHIHTQKQGSSPVDTMTAMLQAHGKACTAEERRSYGGILLHWVDFRAVLNAEQACQQRLLDALWSAQALVQAASSP
jgi:hypothetical protein